MLTSTFSGEAVQTFQNRIDSIQRPGCLFTFGTSRKGAYSRQGAYLFFEKQPNVQNKTLIFIKKGTITNCNSNKYTVTVHLM